MLVPVHSERHIIIIFEIEKKITIKNLALPINYKKVIKKFEWRGTPLDVDKSYSTL